MSPAAIPTLPPRAKSFSPPSKQAQASSNSAFLSAIRSPTVPSSSGPASALSGTALSLEHVLKLAAEIREHSQSVGLVIFSYLNPILRMGLPKFCHVARAAGIDGTLITDLPIEESAEYLREARKNDLATIFLAAPTSTDQRLKQIAQVSTGFVYAISRTGVTGERQKMSSDARDLVKRIRRFTKLPVAVGFGISTPEQFAAIGKFAEGAVVGSAIVHVIEQNPGREAVSVAEFIRRLSAISRQPSARSAR